MMVILRSMIAASIMSFMLALAAFADGVVITGTVSSAGGNSFILKSKNDGKRYIFHMDKNSGYLALLTRAVKTGAELTVIGSAAGAAASPGKDQAGASRGYQTFSPLHVLTPGRSGIERGEFVKLRLVKGHEEDESYYLTYLDRNGVKHSILGAGVLPSFYQLENTRKFSGKKLKIYWDTVGPLKAAVHVELLKR